MYQASTTVGSTNWTPKYGMDFWEHNTVGSEEAFRPETLVVDIWRSAVAHSMLIEVEENKNCEYMPQQLYEAHADPIPISRVHVDEPGRPTAVYCVTGWCSEGDGSPCPALYVPVSDSGQAVVHLVYGGDWGIRLKPLNSDEEWDIDSADQWGEPYLMLTSESDIILGHD